METIIYNGRKYDLETVKSYYEFTVTETMHPNYDTEQEFFDEYIKRDPEFVELFKSDIDPID